MKCPGSDKTLRDLIMGIKGNDSELPFFASIDCKWNGQGVNFSFHPDKLIKASMTIRGLYPRLAHDYGEEVIHRFFTPRAVVEGRRMMYDPKTGTVTTEADESIVALDKLDLDMVVKVDIKQDTFGERQVFVKEWGDEDSASTFQSKWAPPTEINMNTTTKKTKTTAATSNKSSNSSTLSTTSLSVITKNSVNNRLLATKMTGKASNLRLTQKLISSFGHSTYNQPDQRSPQPKILQ